MQKFKKLGDVREQTTELDENPEFSTVGVYKY